MKEYCPQCNCQFGWSGPRTASHKSRWNFRGDRRLFCPSCGVELKFTSPREERVIYAVAMASLVVGSLGNIWGNFIITPQYIVTSIDLMSAWMVFALYFMGMLSFIVLLFLRLRKRNYTVVPNALGDVKE